MNNKYFGITLSLLIAGATLLCPRNSHAQPTSKYWVEQSDSQRRSSLGDAKLFNDTFVNLAEKLSPAVVSVTTTSEVDVPQFGMNPDDFFNFFFGGPRGAPRQQAPQKRKTQGLGSGIVIHDSGIILTNRHVVTINDRTADSIRIKFFGDPEQSEGYLAEVVGVDPFTDVGVLRLKEKPKNKLTVAPLGNSNLLKVGEWVVAIGNPHGLTHSVSKGIVSALGRDIMEDINADFIQTDASINQGNSGGPLINLSGEVIGINTAIDPRGQGLGFAIPINTAKKVVKQILENGKVSRGYVGVMLYRDFNTEIAKSLGLKEPVGALIGEVVAGDPADKAGLEAYDVVTKIGNRKIDSHRDFMIAVGDLSPGTPVEIEYLRNGKKRSTKLTLADREKGLKNAENNTPRRGRTRNENSSSEPVEKVGLALTELTDQIKKELQLDDDIEGVVVTGVLEASAADLAGIARGDVITEVDRKKVNSVKDLKSSLGKSGRHLIKAFRGNRPVLFTVNIK